MVWERVGVQSDLVCSVCGAPAHRCPPPSIWERVQAWFFDGDRNGGENYECDNAHGWTTWSMRHRCGPVARVAGLWRAVAFSRSVIPTPLSYTVAALVGLIAGVGWGLLFGWPWWLGPIGFVVAAWATATATAFRSPARSETVAAVYDQLRPRGALERRRDRTRRSLEELPFAPLGLVGQPDAPRLGSTSGHGGDISSLSIVYGVLPGPETPSFVEIETTVDDGPVGLRKQLEEKQLRHRAAGRPEWGMHDPSALSADIEWVDCEATVDGTTRVARQAVLGDCWMVAIDDALGRSVVVTGHRLAVIDHVALESIDPVDCPDWLEY